MIELAVGKNKHILKERILKHATMLFYANGVKMIKMDTIAKDLSISKKTLYLFFPTKEDLCLACLVKEKETLCKHMELYKQTGNHNVIEVLMENLLQEMKLFTNINPVFFEDIHKYKRIQNYLLDTEKEHYDEDYLAFQEGIREGLFRNDVDFAIIRTMFRASIENAMQTPLHKEFGFVKIFHDIITTIIRGFSTTKGIEIIDRLLLQ